MIDADQIADALRMPHPTSQQRAVIEAPLSPALVIAGAGSGKTETMANRVLWLLANGHVQAGEILGLTFTRKAAGELASRVRTRITQLHGAGLLPGDYDAFDPPAIATYNSFANTIYRDNALLIGREPDGAVLGEASAWQLARSVVVSSTDDRLPGLDRSVDTITRALLSLCHALSENVVEISEVQRMAAEFAALADLPPGGTGAYAEAVALAGSIGALPVLLDLAHRFTDAKKERGFVEYSDQVALALDIVRRVPRVRDELRRQRRIVLLDEYQDTSVVQTWLLSELFADHPVMAVGDPNQSIYGWRGASAGNLEGFSSQFGTNTETFALTTSWRNGHDVLAVANALVAPLQAGSRVLVEELSPSASASDRSVEVTISETVRDEADAVARWVKTQLVSAGGRTPSAAVLFRARKTQPVFIEAFRRHGVPYHVLGIGGLLAEPEIADLVSALAVINDPSAGSELVRLLAGSRWRVGVSDLHALSRVASWLRDRDYAQKPLDDAVKDSLRASVAADEGGSIVDALDFVAHVREGHHQLESFSAAGLQRLRDAGTTFSRLRARSGLELTDLITIVEQELLLDIEVIANETRRLDAASMEAFFDAVHGYLAVSEHGGLGGFLSWLREAEWRDGLSPRPEDPEPGTVQLLTIHGAKGLEWDAVVVPRFVEGELPAAPVDGTNGWLGFGHLPYEFRGDAAELPVFAWRSAESRKALLAARTRFKQAVGEHLAREERRLAYVAVTRARHALLLTGSFWATQTTPRGPSTFLTELAGDGVIAEPTLASRFDTNPFADVVDTITWPFDPLGSRRQTVERAAQLVGDASPADAGRWQLELDMLLAERSRRLDPATAVEIPARVPASRFKDYVNDPGAVAAALRRPMPERPYRATRLGSLFHSWVESRSGSIGVTETIDALDAELDSSDDTAELQELARLQAIFEQSPWAARQPIEVEREIHLPFDGRIVICKIDAVYEADGRFQIVDWKTGKAPTDAEDLERRQLQLALYRLAYARWRGVDVDSIDAVFYFVSDDRIIAPAHIDDEGELVARWRAAVGSDLPA